MKISNIVKSFKIELTMGVVLIALCTAHSHYTSKLDKRIAEYGQQGTTKGNAHVHPHVVYGDIKIIED